MKPKLFASVLLSVFWVVFLWGFWEKGHAALGVNAFVYLGLLVLFFVAILHREGRYRTNDITWIVPLLLLALSFALFENSFFKVFALVVFPASLALFYVYAWVGDKAERNWNFSFFGAIIERVFSFFSYLGSAFRLLFGFLAFKDGGSKKLALRIIVGLLILLVALFVILPLLSSADAVFGEKIGAFYDAIMDFLSTSFVAKLIVLVIFSIATLAAVLAWGRPHDITAPLREETVFDAVVSGIVLTGILVFYVIFLWVQLDRLWVGSLPFEFAQTETLVKSGFWQLLFLSLINLAIFFFLYRKTVPVVQRILGVFTIASLLLLASSAQRMVLYVTHYGFSYEKFYASYAVLFCAILFVWLLSRLFTARRANVLKFVAFLFLWMFALVSVFPVEQFILRANVRLVRRTDTQIRLFEMTMLSGDVLETIKGYRAQGRLDERRDYLSREAGGSPDEQFDWSPWITEQEQRLKHKKWYEKSLLAY